MIKDSLNRLWGGCTMDKVRSIKILRNCIEKIRNASDAEKEEMARVYEKYDKSDYEEMDEEII